MRVKTSVTLDEETVRAIDEMTGRKGNRSRFIEEAVLAHLERQHRRRRDQRDLEILNRNADRLNEEVEDVLAYQAEPWGVESSIASDVRAAAIHRGAGSSSSSAAKLSSRASSPP